MMTENICTIIISVLGAIIAALITTRMSQKQHSENNNKEDITKAIELADLYEREILPLINGLGIVYSKLNLLNEHQRKLNYLRQNEKLVFTSAEMKLHFEESDIDKVLIELEPKSIPKNLLLSSRAIRGKTLLNDHLFMRSLELGEGEKEKFDLVFKQQLAMEFSSLRTELLNKLESFSMYFTNGVADEEIVYQSLHQTYLGTVLSLYFDIASKNTDPKDTFFINIIELFNKWNSKYNQKKKQEMNEVAKVHDKLTEKPKEYKK